MRAPRPSLAFVALSAALLAGCGSDRQGPTAPAEGPNFAVGGNAAASSGRHLVVFNGQSIPAGFADRVAALGGKVELQNAALGFAAVRGLNAAGVAALAKGAGVMSVGVEPVVQLVLPAAMQSQRVDATVQSPTNPAAATRFPFQWGMRAIHADAAWSAGFLGSPNTTAAILDSGIDYTYPDLAPLVDQDRSIDFVGEADSVTKYFGPGRKAFSDLAGHGSMTASIVASQGTVIAGVTSQTKLVAVKVCNMRGSCPTGAIFAGMQYAADIGANVVNMSLGGEDLKKNDPGFTAVANRATNYLKRKGALLVVSAGNSGLDLDHSGNMYAFLCDAANVVCVSATGPTGQEGDAGPFENVDAPAFYTNFGRSAVSLAAPGGNGIFDADGNLVDVSRVWAACSHTWVAFVSAQPSPTEAPVAAPCFGGTFILGNIGTSFASPHVAGVAALIASKYVGNPAALRARLQQTADDLGQKGTDPFYGKGRVNAARAVGL